MFLCYTSSVPVPAAASLDQLPLVRAARAHHGGSSSSSRINRFILKRLRVSTPYAKGGQAVNDVAGPAAERSSQKGAGHLQNRPMLRQPPPAAELGQRPLPGTYADISPRPARPLRPGAGWTGSAFPRTSSSSAKRPRTAVARLLEETALPTAEAHEEQTIAQDEAARVTSRPHSRFWGPEQSGEGARGQRPFLGCGS